MRIYTSNFSRTQNIPHYSIAVSSPDWDNSIATIRELCPDWSLVSLWNAVKHLDRNNPKVIAVINKYVVEYRKQLDDLNIESLLSDGMVLCCWCKKGDFCHRVILSDYLRERGHEVEEL